MPQVTIKLQILQMLDSGKKPADIAKTLGTTPAYVANVKSEFWRKS